VKILILLKEEHFVLFQAQIQNVTSNILHMEKVTIEPSDGFQVEDLNINVQASHGES
jgi:hypothetical protein